MFSGLSLLLTYHVAPKNLTDLTPKMNIPAKLYELVLCSQKTSSGRVIKPPLAWWRGQRILTDHEHNLIGIEPGMEEQTAVSPYLYSYNSKLPQKVSSCTKLCLNTITT